MDLPFFLLRIWALSESTEDRGSALPISVSSGVERLKWLILGDFIQGERLSYRASSQRKNSVISLLTIDPHCLIFMVG